MFDIKHSLQSVRFDLRKPPRPFGIYLWTLFAMPLLTCASSVSQLKTQTPAQCDAQSTFAKAESLLKERQYLETRVILKQLRSCGKLSPNSTFAIGWLYGRSHDFRTALEIFRSLPSSVPNFETHQYAIALSEFELGKYDQSIDVLEALEAKGTLDSKSANLLGVSYSKLGHYENAYKALKDNLSRNPTDLTSYLNLITLLADAGHFSDAETVANQAVNQFPRNPEVLIVRGAAHTLQGELEQAIQDFAAAVNLSHREPEPRFLLALSEYRKADYEGASRTIRSAIASGVVDSDLYYLSAECLLKSDPGNPDRAVAELNRAINLNPKAVAALTLRGKLLLEGGKVKAALLDLEFAHRLDPSSRSAAYNLARAEFKSGRTREANNLFRELQSETGDTLTELSNQRLQKALRPESPQ